MAIVASYNTWMKVNFLRIVELWYVVTRKNALTIVKYSEKHGRLELAGHLNNLISKPLTRAILVHKTCQRDFTDAKRIRI